MNTTEISAIVNPGEPGITYQRIFNAPRELVFDVWTQPQHIAKWWGPNGFTNTTQKMDVRPGGVWESVMHGPDGTDYKNTIVYNEVTPPERLVYTHESGPWFKATITFEEYGDQTRLTMQTIFESTEQRDRTIKAVNAVEGGKQTLTRLATYLDEMQNPPEEEFVVTRIFDAPRDLVWKAHTEIERFSQWWGPKGFTMLAANLDLRPGGLFHYGMESPQGHQMWGKFVFREIVPQEKLVYVVSFSDPDGGTTRHPMSESWPLEVLNTSIFTELDGKTRLTLRGIPINATAEERKTFKDGHKSMEGGFKGTLDQLEEYLAKV
jgi:uncharacterized protein YndB with AHSA1/START domain